jgi:formylglycine-generating enzyme required for sulfatase activity
MQTFKSWVLMGLIGISFSSAAFAEPGGAKSHGEFEVFPPEVVSEILGKLPSVFDQFKMTAVFPELFLKAKAAHQFSLGKDLSLVQALIQLDRQFVTIPEGFLPSEDPQLPENLIPVPSFEADQYPVTEKLWQEIMGSFPDAKTEFKSLGPKYPITHVNWENEDGSPAEVQEFLARLNIAAEKAGQRCTYDLPTDHQNWYLQRADVTGKYTTAKYTVAKDEQGNLIDVTDANVDEYMTYSGNSNGKIQPVGGKKPNAFGIERGNVWKMSKDIFDSQAPHYGRSSHGCSALFGLCYAEPQTRLSAVAGYRGSRLGFSLVRTCSQ